MPYKVGSEGISTQYGLLPAADGEGALPRLCCVDLPAIRRGFVVIAIRNIGARGCAVPTRDRQKGMDFCLHGRSQ